MNEALQQVVYVATAEPYHDNSLLIGVFETLEAAKAAFPPSDWNTYGNDGTWTAQLSDHDDEFQIVRVEVGSVQAQLRGPR